MRASDAMTGRLGRRDRGDVPAWVLITVMTAGLVVIIWGVASEQLQQMFNSAMDSVTGPGAGS
ncbi:hypothetical protein [Motilibacter deserti]|uniref:Flp pilus assembly pilin Flp n=1 Tax=Motilibacter deserti TaxID=2714956 RepID=A0ABX0GR38_9ACTN|nr:hypothetical protein [Motilibacter deserti]